MKIIKLEAEQVKKLKELCLEFFPNNIWVRRSRSENHIVDIGIENGIQYVRNIHWLECCLYHIAPKVAELHGKQPFTTKTWSEHMILQKLVHEINRVNPIDTLYDIWKHPEKYAQDL